MKYETETKKTTILDALKNNLNRRNMSMVTVKCLGLFPTRQSCTIYVVDGLLTEKDADPLEDALLDEQIPLPGRSLASIRMIFSPPYEAEFNWKLDFKRLQECMAAISDAMSGKLHTQPPIKKKEGEYGGAEITLHFGKVKKIPLFEPYKTEQKTA